MANPLIKLLLNKPSSLQMSEGGKEANYVANNKSMTVGGGNDEDSSCSSHSRSTPIPINRIQRTHSEIQLMEDEAVADYKDYCMFQRIVSGMVRNSPSNAQCYGNYPGYTQEDEEENHTILRNVIRTRNCNATEVQSKQSSFIFPAFGATACGFGLDHLDSLADASSFSYFETDDEGTHDCVFDMDL